MPQSYSGSAVCCLSGTGKTLLARAIASNIDANFLKVRAGREKLGATVDKCGGRHIAGSGLHIISIHVLYRVPFLPHS